MMRVLVVALILLPLAACAKTDLIDEFELAGGDSHSVSIKGEAPYVIVANEGPGMVQVAVDGPTGPIDRRRVRPGAKGGFTTFGPATVTCTATTDLAARVSIRAREVRQMELEAAGRAGP
ncbi:MAG: hypothetical protein ACYTGG_09210 [Planctomycetota bacterium]|jgi:hypothetical protein